MGVGTVKPRLVFREPKAEPGIIRPLGNLLRTSVIVVGIMAAAVTARADPTKYMVDVRLTSVGSNGQTDKCGIDIAAEGIRLTNGEKNKIAKIVCKADKRAERPSKRELLDPFASNLPANGNGAKPKPSKGDHDYTLAWQWQ